MKMNEKFIEEKTGRMSKLFYEDSSERRIDIDKNKANDQPTLLADQVASGDWSLLLDLTTIVMDGPEFIDGEPEYGPGGRKQMMDRGKEHYVFKEDVNNKVVSILSENGTEVANFRARKVYQYSSKEELRSVVEDIEDIVMDEDNWKIRSSVTDPV